MFRKPDGAGKGDAPRPIKDKEQFDKNWEAIFNKKPEKCINYEHEENPKTPKPQNPRD